MLHNRTGNGRSALMGFCALAIAAGLNISTAKAEDDRYSKPVVAHVAPQELPSVQVSPGNSSSKPYFVEFRARSALSYGHTFLVHGRVGQKITAKDVVGLHPATESSIPWMIGHVVPVISETGASDGDYEDQYITARYRVLLTEAEYKKTLATMRKMQASSPVWHAVLYNCNRFVGDIAETMGLRSPSNSMQYPKEYINALKTLNGGRSALSGSGSSKEAASARSTQTAAAAPKRQQAAAPRQEANVTPQTRQDWRPE